MPEFEHLSFDVDRVGVATLQIDRAGASVNMLSPEILDELGHVLARCERDPAVRAVVLTSGKEDSFIVGADIRWLGSLSDPDRIRPLFEQVHAGFARLEELGTKHGKPVVAAVHGTCLGGGLETALCCMAIVASDHARTQFGQPEVRLGLIPGGGGTQRLPRRVGLANGLDLILTGRSVSASRAAAMGLVDEVCPPGELIERARARAVSLIGRTEAPRRPIARDIARLVERSRPGRRLIFFRAAKSVQARTRGHYPAPPAAIRAIRAGYEHGLEAGFAREIEEFSRLPGTPEARALISLFFATRELKREDWGGEAPPRHVARVGIVGGGLMGSGIGAVSVMRAEIPTTIKEVDDTAVVKALDHVRRAVESRSKRSGRPGPDVDDLLSGTTEASGLAEADIVIEAVFEDLTLKRRILAEVEEVTGPGTVFASNTSSIPIALIASEANRPQEVIGMHYFSPVERMPLLEVIATEATSAETVATAVELGKRQGKTVIVVSDGPGFYTTRILAPYVAEALHLLQEGVAVDMIDGAMTDWGFPIGPLALSDEVGIDVGAKIAGVLEEAFGTRVTSPQALALLIADGRRGKKNGRGFYRYERGKRKTVDDTVYKVLGVSAGSNVSPAEIQERLVLQMVNEAARCLEEGVVRSARDADVGAVLGLGFPPFRGGPLWYVDQTGADRTVASLSRLAADHGPRFEPAGLLIRRASNGRTLRG